MVLLSDLHRYPFSLINEAKAKQHAATLHSSSSIESSSSCNVIQKVGDVSDVMDNTIGRTVVLLKGSISAKNYIEFSHLNLTGRFVHIQLQVLEQVATFHFELLTKNDLPLRISVSTLYSHDQPKNLGASLRIPLPNVRGWMVLVLDMDEIIQRYSNPSIASPSKRNNKFKAIRKVQICSNMMVRDLVTSDKNLSNHVPKELAIKAKSAVEMPWINLTEVYPSASSISPDVLQLKSPKLKIDAVILRNQVDCSDGTNSNRILYNDDDDSNKFDFSTNLKSALTPVDLPRRPLTATGNAIPRSPLISNYKKNNTNNSSSSSNSSGYKKSEDDISVISKSTYDNLTPYQTQSLPIAAVSTPNVEVENIATINSTTPSSTRTRQHTLSQPSVTPPSSIVKQCIPETDPADRVLALDRIMGYAGGPSLLLYDAKLLVITCDSLIVLIDIDGLAPTYLQDQQHPGLWKAFKSHNYTSSTSGNADITSAISNSSSNINKQAFLKGHSGAIGILEVSADFKYMISCETLQASPSLLIWDLVQGKKVVTLKPHTDGISSIAISSDNSMLTTVGTDSHGRIQIIVWDMVLLVLEKGVVYPTSSTMIVAGSDRTTSINPNTVTGGLIIAKQLSDFHIARIAFSPFDCDGLVSCGRENIRFWRMRKGHLPGRPVPLNDFCRGYVFNGIVFYAEPGLHPKDPRRPCVYVSSNKGTLIKIDCAKEQVLCAYKLHQGAIRSLALRSGYAVTGGDDLKLKLWPLDFADFLLEAQHESAVTSIHIAEDGKKLSVGTTFGTLGILDVSEHNYTTILRSHSGNIVSLSSRGSLGSEFVTLGTDCTIRIWDLLTGQQKFEFSSPDDPPVSSCYHPFMHVLAVGFQSGCVRIFEVETTTTMNERTQHESSILQLSYVRSIDDKVLLFTASGDGDIVVYDAVDNYNPMKKLHFISNSSSSNSNSNSVRMAVSRDNKLVAVSSSCLTSLTIIDAVSLTITHKYHAIASPHSINSVSGSNSSKKASHSSSDASSCSSVLSQFINSLTKYGQIHVPVTGISFDDKPSSIALLLTTDKYICSLPIESVDSVTDGSATVTSVEASTPVSSSKHRESSVGTSSSKYKKFDEKVMRRVDFGTIKCMYRDAVTGVLFLAVKAPTSATTAATTTAAITATAAAADVTSGSNKGNDDADSLVIVDVKHRVLSPDKLSLSSAQMYRDQPGSITSICPLTQSGKVVTVSSDGCLALWNVRYDRLRKMSDTYTSSPAYKHHQHLQHQSSHSGNRIVGTTNDNNGSAYASKVIVPSEHKHQSNTHRGLSSDFEGAVDDGMTQTEKSCGSSDDNDNGLHSILPPSPSPIAHTMSSAVATPSPSTHYNSSSADKCTSDSNTKMKLFNTALSYWEECNGGPSYNADVQQVAQIATATSSESLPKGLQVQVKKSIESQLDHVYKRQQEVEEGSAACRKINILNMTNAVSPCLCMNKKLFVTSDGSHIIVKSIGSGYDKCLESPVGSSISPAIALSAILSTSISHSGLFIAAIVASSHGLLPYELIIWTYNSAVDSWQLLHGVSLNCSKKTSTTAATTSASSLAGGYIHISWTHDDSLVLGIQSNDSIITSVVNADTILAGAGSSSLVNYLGSHSQKLPITGDITSMKVLPADATSSNLFAFIMSGSKIHCAISQNDSNSTITPSLLHSSIIWSKDIQQRGPYVSMDAVSYARDHHTVENVSSVFATLDSFGLVDIFLIPKAAPGYRYMAPKHVKAAFTQPSQQSGHPHSVHLAIGINRSDRSSETTYVILAYQCSIRLYTVAFKQLLGQPLSATLRLCHKVPLNFTPDYVIPIQRYSHEGTSTYPSLVAASSAGHMEYVDCIPSSGTATSDCLLLSSPPHTKALSMAVCSNTQVMVAIVKGRVFLHHSVTGIALPFPSATGVTNATCVVATEGLFAVGTSCGRITVYDSSDMSIVRTITYQAKVANDASKSYPMSSTSRKGSTSSSISSSSAVVSVIFISGDDVIVSLHDDGAVIVTIIRSSGGQTKLPMRKTIAPIRARMHLLACDDDDTIFSVIRSDDDQCITSSVLMVYRMSYAKGFDKASPVIVPSVTTVIAGAKFDYRHHDSSSSSSYRCKTMRFVDVKLMRVKGWLYVCGVVVDTVKECAYEMVAAAVDMSVTSVKAATPIPLYHRLHLCSQLHHHAFFRHTGVFAAATGVFAIDLLGVCEGVKCSAARDTIATMTDDEVYEACTVILTSSNTSVCDSDWSNATVAVAAAVSIDGTYDSSQKLEVYVSKRSRPCLLRISL